MSQPSSIFIAGEIIEMPSVKFFLKHPVLTNCVKSEEKLADSPHLVTDYYLHRAGTKLFTQQIFTNFYTTDIYSF